MTMALAHLPWLVAGLVRAPPGLHVLPATPRYSASAQLRMVVPPRSEAPLFTIIRESYAKVSTARTDVPPDVKVGARGQINI